MGAVFKYSGWLVSVILLFICGILLNSALASKKAILALQDGVPAPVVAENSALRLELDAVKAEKTALEAELATLKSASVAPPPAAVEADPAVEVPPEPLQEAEAAPAGDPAADEGRGERVANAQLAIMADMMYQELFDELNLTPEVRAALKDSIAAHMLTMQQETMAAMGARNETAKSFHARMEGMKAELRDELANTLSPEELAAWDAYEPVADQVLYERMVDGQLNMMAPGLSNENRVLASQVLAEELVRELDVFEQSEEMYTMDTYNNAQARALNASLERLAGELDEEQYGQVRGFVEQAIGVFEAMADQQAPVE